MDHWDQPDEGIWETRAIHLVVGELIIPSGDGWEAAMVAPATRIRGRVPWRELQAEGLFNW